MFLIPFFFQHCRFAVTHNPVTAESNDQNQTYRDRARGQRIRQVQARASPSGAASGQFFKGRQRACQSWRGTRTWA